MTTERVGHCRIRHADVFFILFDFFLWQVFRYFSETVIIIPGQKQNRLLPFFLRAFATK